MLPNFREIVQQFLPATSSGRCHSCPVEKEVNGGLGLIPTYGPIAPTAEQWAEIKATMRLQHNAAPVAGIDSSPGRNQCVYQETTCPLKRNGPPPDGQTIYCFMIRPQRSTTSD